MPPRKRIKSQSANIEPVNPASSESESEDPEHSGCDWRDRCRSLSEKYDYVLKNNVLTDVKMIVGKQGTVFHAHRIILALGSPVFEAMFYGELAETGDSVTIPDVDPEGFRHFLEFLYTGEYTGEYNEPHDETAFKTYFAADKYLVNQLKKRCEEIICLSDVCPANVWTFLENALLLNSERIRHKCLKMLRHQLNSALEQSSFLDVSFSTIEALLNLDDLDVSEEKLLKNVILWAETRSQAGGDSFENNLKPLLPNIRFGALTAQEIVNLQLCTRLSEVLSVPDNLAILEHIIDPNLCQLPTWCCAKGHRVTEAHPEKVTSPSSPQHIQSCRRKNSKRKREKLSSNSSSSATTSSSESSSSSGKTSDSSSSSSETSD